MIQVCGDVNSGNSISVAVFSSSTNYQATRFDTLPRTPEASAIDLLMRNVGRTGDT